MFSATDGGDASSSPFTAMMDTTDPMILTGGFSSFESFNPPLPIIEESTSKNQEIVIKDNASSGSMTYNPPPNNTEFERLIKAEAMMTFAPEYGAVETPATDLISSVIKTPYVPKSRTVESANSSTNSYVYSAVPPRRDATDDKAGPGTNSKDKYLLQSKKYYTHVENGTDKKDEKPSSRDIVVTSREDVTPSTLSVNTGLRSSSRNKMTGTESIVVSSKTGIANELECLMFQAFMCRIKHTLLTPASSLPAGLNRLSGTNNVLYQMHGESNVLQDNNITSKYDIKKKDMPVRIAGDLDSGLLDGSLNSPVGVWRTVGVTKGSKPMSNMEPFGSLPHNSFNEEGMLSYGQRQPLLELLDGMSLLFQQAASFVDVTLDADCGDGPYGWLAMQEQWRRRFSCGPSFAHAGCGGVLASCHSLDIAGVELADPLSAEVSFCTCSL